MESQNKTMIRNEKIPTVIVENEQDAVIVVADAITELIQQRSRENRSAVLGLATGSTPVPLYRELIRRHREQGLSFKNVITFNLDEYYPIQPDHPESYNRFMREQLFDHIDIPEMQIHIPDGACDRTEVLGSCDTYEKQIQEAGGLDIQILGIGRTGHIGFNEPGSTEESMTRLVTLDSVTRSDAAKDFLGEANVPRNAVTMGVGTILQAKRVFLMAWGRAKAEILREAIEGEPNSGVPASFLQLHSNATFYIDHAAASELTRFRSPWLVSMPDWSPSLIRQAVTDLSLLQKKPLLKLVDKDYQENGLADLVTQAGPAYQLNIRIFNELQHTITGWPGGKPGTDDSNRPERAEPSQKRILILSAEPLDDMVAMAGTLNRLVTQGHQVSVAYLTSGNLGVSDGEASWLADLMIEAAPDGENKFAEEALESLANKRKDEQDSSPVIRKLKGLIRRNEARSSLRICGLPREQVHFLDLPFYELGRYRRFYPKSEDVLVLQKLMQQIQPHQIFFGGAEADPSSVHAKCFQVMKEALQGLSSESWVKDCYFWQYAAGDREWDIDQIEMAVPCSPDELSRKLQAIYQHRSQMGQVPLSQAEHPELWQQSRARNNETAERYNQLGLAEYEAMECFVRWNP